MAEVVAADVPVAESAVPEVATTFVTVYNLPGATLATVSPMPATILELKVAIQEQTSVPVALQKLLEFGGMRILDNSEDISGESLQVTMVTDETAFFSWDVAGNPDKDMLELEGTSIVTCAKLQSDYVNVLSREPITKGVHYFEFVMHFIGDEQWCGVVMDPSQAGRRCGGRSLKAWTYYCGRMRHGGGTIRDGMGALHAEGRAVAEFKKVSAEGDIIGMLVDLDSGAIAFDLNGELQGACALPTATPMWVLTHVDTPKDKVELRKPSLLDAPPANLEALSGALLEIKKGEKLGYGAHDSDSD